MLDAQDAGTGVLVEDANAAGVAGSAALSAKTAAATSAALLLAACGGGSGGSSPTPTASTPVVVAPAAITTAQASRFLAQSTMGATRAMIDTVVSRRFDGWIDDQFALPRATSHWDWLNANGYNVAANINSETGFDATMWRQLIAEPDQLRQRVGMALLDMLVVGIGGVNLNWKQFATAAYVDVLLDNAFGNYRTLMDAITANAAMGSFLTFLGNRKANTTTGAQPDENYARELMQLFTLGLYQLNMDGSVKTGASGAPLETYTQADVTGLARVFTGLSLSSSDSTTPNRYRVPLVMNAAINETGTATFLGTTTSGGGMAAIKVALDTIFAHPNMPPFVSKQLIQRLVTSNPSPAYVGRVAATFADNGSGVRGDMKAVLKAILLDTEARSDTALTSTTAGKLREPVMRLTAWARAFGVTSPSNAWAIGDTSNMSSRLAQSMGRSQTVFNFFRPGYAPPATGIASAGLVAPEFQITNEQSVVAYVNYMQGLVQNGTGDVKADYTAILTKASDSAALVDEVNLVLAAGQLSATTVTAIRAAVDSVATTAANAAQNRVNIAILLTLASPEFITVR
ncbi:MULTISPECIES: DUF1800 family protein [unclassified Sphingomonas]|jgi:uncharacterized protein (DUF1800 family)|uniref:DUF1800 domain-containing protein n=1 Tax=unclassified Sphingomonas TaxID=196159 RepID=UPI000E10899D|nr:MULTISPECIES: DUF1800 domain-containing protein [unclassified Sphingomonas]AXJ95004.1 DUF1800 domain-containing protein [Sphingomonas sp. FARSPH]